MRSDRRPLPLQVRDEIRDLVRSDGLHAGDRLPSEAELATRFGVARTTVREGLKLLEQDGLIEVRHGRGRFVAALPMLQRPITRLESVTEMMATLGYEVTTRVLAVREGPASDAERGALRLPEEARVVRLERLRLQDDDPLVYSVEVLPREAVPGPLGRERFSGSLLELLAAHGHRVASAHAQIRAVTLPRPLARRLGLPAATPWLLLIHVNLDERGRPIIYSHDYHRGDHFTFHAVRRRAK